MNDNQLLRYSRHILLDEVGIDVGAPLPPQASGGRAGVFFNGRNLADAEIAWLQTLGPVWPGRY
jgi:hypothetical protein